MPEITVASTTDAQNEIDLAAGALAETQKEEVIEGEEQKESSESEQGEKEPWQNKRIAKLTAEKKQTQKQLNEVLARLDAIEKGSPLKAEVKAPVAEVKDVPKPKPEQFASYEEFTEALAGWKLEEKLGKIRKDDDDARTAKTQQDAANAVIQKYNERLTDAKERYDDFDDVVGKTTQVPEGAVRAIIQLENGPDVAYYLGQHPEICKKLMGMDQIAAIAEVGKISQALVPNEEVEEEAPHPAQRIMTRAKEPIRPVGASSTKSSVPIDEMPYNEYRRIRDKQEKDRYRR
jgi:hypothetical protein